MIGIEDIEFAVEALGPEQLARFRDWFESFSARRFDEAIERDAKQGKLDSQALRAREEFKSGRATEL